ncbi:MAG TPA: phosphatase PAP2-related protein [Polyangiaceae bacterium]|nr:phosphatase PAP2-related protein [Polyangiaceae bacterium]
MPVPPRSARPSRPDSGSSLGTPSAAQPRKLSLAVWAVTALAFIASYALLWCYVHVRVDTQPCLVRLDDPLFALIPKDRRFFLVSHELYTGLTLGALALLVWWAYRGNHFPLVRFGAALSLQGLFRAVTLLLLPLCRVNIQPGTVVLDHTPLVDLGIVRIPWRMWATNDLFFSGHVGEFLLLTWAMRGAPRPIIGVLVVFQVVQAYALIATRGHYTIDLLVAVPFAFMADRIAVAWLGKRRQSPRAVDAAVTA